MIDSSRIDHNELTSGDGGDVAEPLQLFSEWFAEAKRLEPRDPDAMALATVDADGLPDVRMVLMKGFDERGFVFYTNRNSQKGREIAAQPKAALVMHWKSMNRQVRVRGPVSIVSDEESDAYFASRPRMSQIGAWASDQSAPLESRLAFEKSVALQTAKYAVGIVPRPPYWIGYRIVPLVIEFWAERPFRLHERIEFRRSDPASAWANKTWAKTRLYP